MIIRNATHDDLPTIVALGAQMHAESRFAILEFDREKVERFIAHMIDQGQFVRLAEKDGEVIGGFVGFVTEHWASKDLVAYDCGLFISPDRRGGVTAVRLLEQFRAWSIEKGCAMCTIGINTGVHVEKTARLFEHVGFDRVGYLYEGIQ